MNFGHIDYAESEYNYENFSNFLTIVKTLKICKLGLKTQSSFKTYLFIPKVNQAIEFKLEVSFCYEK